MSMIIIVIVILIALLITAKFYYRSKNKAVGKLKYRNFDEIPQPKGIPLFGNLNDFLLSKVETWKTARKRALEFYPIYRLRMMNKNLVFILSPDDIATIFGNADSTIRGEMFHTIRDWAGPGLLSNEGRLWYDRRTLISRMFTPSALDSYTTIFNSGIKEFSDEIQKNINEPIDKILDIGICVMRILSEVIAGKRLKMDRNYTECYINSLNALCKSMDYNQMRPYMKLIIPFTNFKTEQKEGRKIFHGYSRKVVEKMRDPEVFSDEIPPILSIFANNPERFNEKDMMFEINNLLVSGHETQAAIIWFTLNLLADYPEWQAEIHQEIMDLIGDGEMNRLNIAKLDRLDRFLKESMRIFSPIMYIGRVSVEDMVTKTGYLIPTGTHILLPIFDVHRNPNLFPEPDVFNPNRFTADNVEKMHPSSFVPFGVGPRKCIAQKYSTLNMKMLIVDVLRRYKLESIDRIEEAIFITDVILRTDTPKRIKFLNR